jgi:hypothetical protein
MEQSYNMVTAMSTPMRGEQGALCGAPVLKGRSPLQALLPGDKAERFRYALANITRITVETGDEQWRRGFIH